VLSVCGNTNRAFALLAAAGADALSVDQLNDVARSRAALGPGPLLFGNIDPVGVLVNGTPDTVRDTVAQAITAGVDAIWPGCDLWPDVPPENLHALVEATKATGNRKQEEGSV
jgi:[methyl-Co(III) methanol-specific corrinoid protein]:coenzyme M methyltransferase